MQTLDGQASDRASALHKPIEAEELIKADPLEDQLIKSIYNLTEEIHLPLLMLASTLMTLEGSSMEKPGAGTATPTPSSKTMATPVPRRPPMERRTIGQTCRTL
ncbi:hypothetical protein PtB15_4B781 [Puccinia triticina]|nr:hypothetical protein PtB15_4B781 [Puccinia triticina]